MAETIHFGAKPFTERNIESIQFCGHTNACAEVIYIVESHHCIFLHLVLLFVPALIHAREEHPIVEADTRCDANIFKRHERRRTAQGVSKTVVPILYEATFEEIVFFASDRIAKATIVLQTNFLIPFLFAYTLLALKWIDTTHADCQTWKCHV